MKYLKQLLIILGISFLGELLKYFLPLPIPASIYGMVILFALLSTSPQFIFGVDAAPAAMIGGVLGGWIFSLFGWVPVGTLASLATAVIGSVVLLWIAALVSHRKIR